MKNPLALLQNKQVAKELANKVIASLSNSEDVDLAINKVKFALFELNKKNPDLAIEVKQQINKKYPKSKIEIPNSKEILEMNKESQSTKTNPKQNIVSDQPKIRDKFFTRSELLTLLEKARSESEKPVLVTLYDFKQKQRQAAGSVSDYTSVYSMDDLWKITGSQLTRKHGKLKSIDDYVVDESK